MTHDAAPDDRIEVHSSRWWAFFGGRLTRLLFPAHMSRRPRRHFHQHRRILAHALAAHRRTSAAVAHCRSRAHARLFLGLDQCRKLGRPQSTDGYGPAQRAGPLLRRTRARAHQPIKRDAAATSSLRTRPVLPDDAYAAAATTSPLNLSPCLPAPMTTFSPSLMRPERIISASGSCTYFWITRLSGRAP